MNKCRICNTEFEGNICPNCGHPVLGERNQEEGNKTIYAIFSIILAITPITMYLLAESYISKRLTILFTWFFPIPSVILAVKSDGKSGKSNMLSIISAILSVLSIFVALYINFINILSSCSTL